MYAVVGSDGIRDVVWGVGNSRDAARTDAARWLPSPGCGTVDTRLERIGRRVAERIDAGEIEWAALVSR